jgi:LytS/YehU family sensor histidine kinase
MAIGIGVLMSTQFLAQPFVWRNWQIADVLFGWVQIAGDRVMVAVTIAGAALIGVRIGRSFPRVGILIVVFSIITGSIAGEWGRSLIDPFGDHMDSWSMTGRILQWSTVASAIAGISMAWRSATEAALAAEEAELAQLMTRRATTLAELEMLRRQIEPHFLFNTLATIQRLGKTAPMRGLHLLTRLFDFMTANLKSTGGEQSTLGAELDLARAYLDVCEARMGRRLSTIWEVDETLRAHPFPKYLIGTLIENAIKHGISPKSEGGVIMIVATIQDSQIVVTVTDSGDGLKGLGGNGTGLANLVARLRLIYGGRADFSLRSSATGGAVARVRVPIDPGFDDA